MSREVTPRERREAIAEAIYEGAFAEVYRRILWVNLRDDVKAPIYRAADLVLGLAVLQGGGKTNTSSVAGSSRGFMAPTDGLHSAGKED